MWQNIVSIFSNRSNASRQMSPQQHLHQQTSTQQQAQQQNLYNTALFPQQQNLYNGFPNFNPDLPQHFNDDDEMVVASEPAGAAAQPEPSPTADGDSSISVNTRIEYSSLPRGSTQAIFGLVTVHAADIPEPSDPGSDNARQAMDLMCVLDVSGSMQGEKIKQVKSAVEFVIQQATPKDRLSIVAFNSNASRCLRFRSMDGFGKDEANVAALRLAAGGGTSIAAGLSTALSVMEQRRQRNKVSAILLLTDGQDGSTRHQLPALLARAQAANCSVYAFGFGRDHDAALLSDLAEQAQTPFTFVEDADKIREAFAGAMGGLTSMVAQSVQLSINCFVPLKKVHTAFVMEHTSDTSAKITIPDMFAGESRNVLLELSVPSESAGGDMVLLEAHVRYTDLRSGSLVQTIPVPMQATMVEEPQPEAEPDMEVTAQRERVEVTQTLLEASRQCDEGKFSEAQRALDGADQRMKERKCKSKLSSALSEEIADAKDRMRSRSMWEGGGRAEVGDACQMQQMERCTNAIASSSSCRQKSSKSIYMNARQETWTKMSQG